jgi:hypothetical protein
LKNLAADPAQRERLEKLRGVLIAELRRTQAPYADSLASTPAQK